MEFHSCSFLCDGFYLERVEIASKGKRMKTVLNYSRFIFLTTFLVFAWVGMANAQTGDAQEVIASFNMDNDPGWTTEGQWGFGQPQGMGGDPSSGYTGTNVYGYNLAGKYPNGSARYYLTTTAIDCSNYTNTILTFQRWLGVESSSFDHANIQVSNDGSTWQTVWNHSGGSFSDSTWHEVSYDVSAIADNQATVFIRWGMGTTDSSVTYCGWNIDDVEISGEALYVGELSVVLPDHLTEGDGVLSGAGQILVSAAPTNDLFISLSLGEDAEIVVPTNVVVMAGQTNVVFDVTVLDDAVLDGTQISTLSATYPDYRTGETSVQVFDNESATLTLSLPQTTYEGAGSVAGALLVNPAPDQDVTVELLSDNPGKLGNGSVILPAGQTLVPFSLDIGDDNLIDGLQTATITAQVENWTSGHASIYIVDNEMAVLSIQLPEDATEGDGVLTNSGVVSLSGIAASDFQILLSSADASEVSVPSSVMIAAGQSSTSFDVMVGDDTETDGSQNISVTAQAPNYVPAVDSMTILDDDVHHFAVEGVSGGIPLFESVPVTVSARTIDNLPVYAFTNPVDLSATGDRGSIVVSPDSITNFVGGVGVASIAFGNIGNDVTLTASTGGTTGTSTVFNVTGAQFMITPASLTNVQVVAGGTATRTMVISNAGNADLEFELPDTNTGGGAGTNSLDIGLVAYYPFNGNAADESGNGYDGAVNSATLTTDRFGNADSAYDFNGSSAFINCGNIINGFSNFTVSAWINIDTYTSGDYMGPWSQKRFVYPVSANEYGLMTGNGSVNCFGTSMRWPDWTLFDSRTHYVVPNNEWHLITQTYDGNEVRQYDNGVLINAAVTGAYTLSNSWDFLIGKTCAYPGRLLTTYFDGQIDELRIYNRALSESEIQGLVNEANQATTNDLDAGLVASYPFNGDAADATTNGYDGTVVDATLITNRFGDVDSAYYFDGVNDRIDLPVDVLNFERNVPFSQSFWIKTGDNDAGNNIIAKMQSSGSIRGLNVVLYNGQLRAHLISDASSNNKIQVNGTTVLSDDQWHHVIIAYDGSSMAAGVTFFVDGNLESTTTVFDALRGTILNSVTPTVGSRSSSSYYTGVIDDIRIYNRALSEQEVQGLYNEPNPTATNDLDAGLVASYPFNGDATDETGNGNDGAVYGATLTEDRFGNPDSAYLLDGNDYLILEDQPAVVIGTNDFTYSMWVKTESTSTQMLCQRYKVGDGPYWLRINDSQKTSFTTYDSQYGHLWNQQNVIGLSDGGWHMISCLRQGSTTKVFVDGQLVSTASGTIRNIVNDPGIIYIGVQINNGTLINYFTGVVDDIHIYDHALSDQDILDLYNAPNPAPSDLDAGLVASYPFNGDAADASGNGHDGTVNGPTLTIDRFGNADSAYHFDGVNDIVAIADHDDFTVTDVTVCAWIKTADKSDHKHITSCYDTGYASDWYNLYLTSGSGLARWAVDPGGSVTVPVAVGSSDLADDAWHFVVGVRDASVNELYLYIDGILQATASDIDDSALNPSADFWIGGQNGWPSRYFNGDIDDVRIYNRALSESEIGELYSLTTGSNEPDETWLSVNPTSGTIPPGGSVEVSVTFDASGLEAGMSSNTTLLVVCNDAASSTNSVAVSMRVVSPEALLDVDADGLADAWEQAYFGNAANADPQADTDDDGLNNLAEFIAGTCPTNEASRFVLQQSMVPTNGNFILYWDAVTGRTYSVQWTPVIGDPFQPMATNLYYPCNSYTDTVHGANDAGFYKVGVELE